MEEKRARILELVEQLNHAAAVYYQGRDEVMSNYEYDKQYDELQALEKETGIVLAGSPTQRVGYEVLSEQKNNILHRCFLWTRQRIQNN